MSLTRTTELARIMWSAFSRDRSALFFTIAFPLMFLLVFGAIFGDGQSLSRTQVYVTGDGPIIRALPRDVLSIERVPSVADGERRVRDGDRVALIAERDRKVVLRYAASDQVGAGVVQAIVGGVVNRANLELAGADRAFSVTAGQVEDESLDPIEFYTPGLLAWAVSVGAVFAVAIMLVGWREKGILRQLRLSPVGTGEIAAARVAVSVGVALVQTAVFFAVGVLAFDLDLSGAWWMAVPLVTAGTLAFLAIGLVVGAVSRTIDSASAISNLVVLPMSFLSGAFFPLDSSPGWLQAVARALPLSYLIEGLKDVTVRGQGASGALLEIGVMLGFAVVIGAVGIRVFRWER